jgi:Uma2 family endonuclease
MSAILIPPGPPATTGVSFNPPPRKKWTSDEFHQLGDEGWFEGECVILVNGEILDMPLPNPPHDTATGLTDYTLKSVFQSGFNVRVQMSLVVAQDTDLAPDIAVVAGSPRDFARRKPTTAELVVDISESSLAYDTGDKAHLYAAARIQDYWVINLVDRRLEIRRRPVPDASQAHGFRYADVTLLTENDVVSPLAAPQAQIRVADLLP